MQTYEHNRAHSCPSDSDEESDNEDPSYQQAPPSPTKASEAGDLTCAICLGEIQLENLAMVKGCDHMYCAHCILHWALHKEEPWCPQCKQPFTYLLTYRTLDGELSDFPAEESVVLLKRARWFTDTLRPCARSSSLLEDSILADETAWQEYADEYDLAEDEEIEAYYFSSAAGRARVLLGNRRFGEGGFIATGRRQARPVPKKVKGKGTGKHVRAADAPVCDEAGPSTSRVSPAVNTPNANGGRNKRQDTPQQAQQQRQISPGVAFGTSPHLSGELFLGSSPATGGLYGSSPSGSGRRARRNARRAAADVSGETPPMMPLPHRAASIGRACG